MNNFKIDERKEQEKSFEGETVRKYDNAVSGKRLRNVWEDDPLWQIVGASDSGLTDLAERHDDYLYGKQR